MDPAEPLSLELADFAHAIVTGDQPRSHAELGLEIVGVLEAAETSVARHGAPVLCRTSPALRATRSPADHQRGDRGTGLAPDPQTELAPDEAPQLGVVDPRLAPEHRRRVTGDECGARDARGRRRATRAERATTQ